MKGQVPEVGREVPRLEIPEDVAVLYTWAHLQGARYRDFSASRRELRAQMRQRGADAQHAAEAQASGQAAGTVSATERADAHLPEDLESAAEPARRTGPEINRLKGSFEGQAQRDLTPQQLESLAPADESNPPLAALTDPYTPRPQAPPARVLAGPSVPEEDMRPERFPQRRTPQIMVPSAESAAGRPTGRIPMKHGVQTASDSSVQGSGASEPFPASNRHEQTAAIEHVLHQQDLQTQIVRATVARSETERDASAELPPPGKPPEEKRVGFVERRSEPRVRLRVAEDPTEVTVPAWIHGQEPGALSSERAKAEPAPVLDTLQHSRERVASRWYALRGVFHPATPEMEPMQARARETASPVLAVFSPAGGVGKTSLTASLGRSLSAVGERVLLADLTSQGILPFYFGATELRPGAMRTFSPPPGSADAPVSMLSFNFGGQAGASEAAGQELLDQLARGKESYQHVLADLGPVAATVLKGLARLDATVLVPVAPDMNTVISLASMERFFAGMSDSAGRPLQPRYLLTQFEATLPLHLDVREGLRQKLGQRLLPFAIRRSTEVSEALAEGMTVIDYAPESGVAADYRTLADWLRLLAAPGQPESRAARWSER